MKSVPTRPIGRLRTVLLIAGAAAAVVAGTVLLTSPASAATQYCSNSTGGSNGSYYQMWTAGQGSACISLNSATSYTAQWSGIGDFVAGVGWKPGSTSRVINYSGSLSANGGTNLLSLYGWSTNPLVEYYVIDGYVGSPNYSGQNMGTMTSDGGTYTIIKHQQVNQPCITGNNCTFWQYLAIRNSSRTSGTITFSNFVSAWAGKGMNLGSMDYQIMATEAWGGGSGNSSVTIGGTPPSSPTQSNSPSRSPSASPSVSPSPSASTGTGGGACRVTNSLNPWNTGLTDNITITNSGSSTINGLSLKFTLASGQTITSGWNATYAPSSGQVTATNVSYNGTIPPGGSTTIGFQANHTGNTAAPSGFTLNGAACS
jgi:endo-1,4-beta-xylanase